jgi:hypothetical protein
MRLLVSLRGTLLPIGSFALSVAMALFAQSTTAKKGVPNRLVGAWD